MALETTNAKITGTSLGFEDHGIMSFIVFLEWSGSRVGYGGYAIDSYNQETKERDSSGFGVLAIRKILEVVGVKRWENLQGQYVRIEDNGIGNSVTKIGNILKDDWFDIKEFSENYRKED